MSSKNIVKTNNNNFNQTHFNQTNFIPT